MFKKVSVELSWSYVFPSQVQSTRAFTVLDISAPSFEDAFCPMFNKYVVVVVFPQFLNYRNPF